MGTYIYARLQDKSEQSIQHANRVLKEFGYPTDEHEGVLYGFFNSRAMLQEDARFMNEDEEGLKQMEHVERPITVDYLQSFFWNEIGCGIIKITGVEPDSPQEDTVKLVTQWLQTDVAKDLLDLDESDLHLDRAIEYYNPQ